MNLARARSRAFICGAVLLALQPVIGAAQAAGAPGASDGVDADVLRQVLESAGYTVGAAVPWGDQAVVVVEGRADSGRIVRAFVYHDAQAAGAARRQAYANWARSDADFLRDGEDAGPQLLSGFGASTWRRNIALVQSSPELFAELMPAEPDCTDPTAIRGADLSRAVYQVDVNIVALVDALP